MIKAVLFDLDGTLIHMDQDEFIKHYFHRITAYFAAHGYDAERFSKCLYKSVGAMLKNDGAMNNDELFWKTLSSLYGKEVINDYHKFEIFYETEFNKLEPLCGPKEGVHALLDELRKMKLPLVLASNSVYPLIAYEKRMAWGGITSEPFEFITTYDSINYCKPHAEYFLEVARRLGVEPSECIMVGNDVSDDMPARHTGMHVFLLTDYLLNPKNEDITDLPQGNYDDLLAYIKRNV